MEPIFSPRAFSRVASMRLKIDFSGQRRGPTRGALLLLVLALALAAPIAMQCGSTYFENRQVVQLLAEAHVQAKQRERSIPPKQVEAINRAIRQLNLPWQSLFASVETNLSDRVALLSLEPDASNHILKIQAEAKSPDDMMDFIDALAGDSLFLTTYLVRHEVNESDRNRPYRFTLEATWQTAL